MIFVKFTACILTGYLIGSIPFGVLISRWMSKKDVRAYGSGKTGTTNVLRTAGKKAAVTVILLDILKGASAVIISGFIIGNYYLVIDDYALGLLTAQMLGGLAAIAGHNWSVFLKFQGGRGVATFFGGLLALCPGAALFAGEIGILSAGLTGFASLGSLIGVVGTYAVLVPLILVHGFPLEYLIYALVGTIAITIMHRDNIVRLIKGKERKLGQKAEKIDSAPSGESVG